MTIENDFLKDNPLKRAEMKKNKHNFKCVVDKQTRTSQIFGRRKKHPKETRTITKERREVMSTSPEQHGD
jgi:hypothetical protein